MEIAWNSEELGLAFGQFLTETDQGPAIPAPSQPQSVDIT